MSKRKLTTTQPTGPRLRSGPFENSLDSSDVDEDYEPNSMISATTSNAEQEEVQEQAQEEVQQGDLKEEEDEEQSYSLYYRDEEGNLVPVNEEDLDDDVEYEYEYQYLEEEENEETEEKSQETELSQLQNNYQEKEQQYQIFQSSEQPSETELVTFTESNSSESKTINNVQDSQYGSTLTSNDAQNFNQKVDKLNQILDSGCQPKVQFESGTDKSLDSGTSSSKQDSKQKATSSRQQNLLGPKSQSRLRIKSNYDSESDEFDLSTHLQNFPSYRPDVDGLRALSIIFVLLFHYNKDWLPGGYYGVDMFFVISGFVVTRSLIIDMLSNYNDAESDQSGTSKKILSLKAKQQRQKLAQQIIKEHEKMNPNQKPLTKYQVIQQIKIKEAEKIVNQNFDQPDGPDTKHQDSECQFPPNSDSDSFWNSNELFFVLRFYARRCQRLLPAALFAIVGSVMLETSLQLITGLNTCYRQHYHAALFSIFGMGNIYFIHFKPEGYFESLDNTNPFLHFWSLGVEEQFYLMVPSLVLLVMNFGYKYKKVDKNKSQMGKELDLYYLYQPILSNDLTWLWIMFSSLVIPSVIYCVYVTNFSENPKIAYQSVWARLWELLVGCILAVTEQILFLNPSIRKNLKLQQVNKHRESRRRTSMSLSNNNNKSSSSSEDSDYNWIYMVIPQFLVVIFLIYLLIYPSSTEYSPFPGHLPIVCGTSMLISLGFFQTYDTVYRKIAKEGRRSSYSTRGVPDQQKKIGYHVVYGNPTGPSVFLNRILSTQPLPWFGQLSYALYLWHWPILVILQRETDLSILKIFIVTFVIAVLTRYVVEKPLMNRFRSQKQASDSANSKSKEQTLNNGPKFKTTTNNVKATFHPVVILLVGFVFVILGSGSIVLMHERLCINEGSKGSNNSSSNSTNPESISKLTSMNLISGSSSNNNVKTDSYSGSLFVQMGLTNKPPFFYSENNLKNANHIVANKTESVSGVPGASGKKNANMEF